MLDCVIWRAQYTYTLIIDALAPHSNRLNVTRGGLRKPLWTDLKVVTEGSGEDCTHPGKDRMYPESLHCALQAINQRTPQYSRSPLAVTMHTHIPPLKSLLFLFSLFCSASSQRLTGAQINIVKQQLQEGATHRSASYHILFLSSWWSLGHPSFACHHYLNPRYSNNEMRAQLRLHRPLTRWF